jgi:hypothetical protein
MKSVPSGLLTCVKSLRQGLEPTANVHQHRNLGDLKALALRVKDLVDKLPPGSVQDCRQDLHLALKAIVQERVRKVDLCVDD